MGKGKRRRYPNFLKSWSFVLFSLTNKPAKERKKKEKIWIKKQTKRKIKKTKISLIFCPLFEASTVRPHLREPHCQRRRRYRRRLQLPLQSASRLRCLRLNPKVMTLTGLSTIRIWTLIGLVFWYAYYLLVHVVSFLWFLVRWRLYWSNAYLIEFFCSCVVFQAIKYGNDGEFRWLLSCAQIEFE